MSKKLIAVAAAAALALTGLVASPASATTAAIDGETAGTGTTAAGAITVNVPTQDIVRFSSTAAQSAAIEFKVAATTATGVVTVAATGDIKLISKADFDTANALASTIPTSKSGAQSLSITAAGSEAIFYAFTTSTATGTVAITNAGNTLTRFVKGIAGLAYNVTATGPATASKGVKYKFSATVKDLFGNPITSGLTVNSDGFVLGELGAFTAAATLSSAVGNGTGGVWNFESDVAESGPGLITVSVAGNKAVTANVAGQPDRSLSATISVGSSDPAAQIASLTAQVAALQATMADMRTKARSVTKKKYNTLARKWNAANPSARVALKK